MKSMASVDGEIQSRKKIDMMIVLKKRVNIGFLSSGKYATQNAGQTRNIHGKYLENIAKGKFIRCIKYFSGESILKSIALKGILCASSVRGITHIAMQNSRIRTPITKPGFASFGHTVIGRRINISGVTKSMIANQFIV